MDAAKRGGGERLKIGLVVESNLNYPGGTQEFARGLYDYLAGSGHEVALISSGRASADDRDRKVFLLGKSLEIFRPGSAASNPLILPRRGKIDGLFRANAFDVLHVQGPGFLFNRRIVFRSAAANILSFQAYHEGAWIKMTAPLWPIWRTQTRRFAARIAQSRISVPLARKFFPGEWIVLPGGVDTARFSPRGERFSRFGDGKINILFLGRLDRRKGVLDLLEAARRLTSDSPIRLIIAGDGPERVRAERFVREGHLPEVVFLGRVEAERLPSLYRTADVFCAPTKRGECLGLVLLEAMASGLPIVAGANPAYREVLGKTAAGDFLAAPGDAADLAGKLRLLIGNPDLRARLGRAMERESGKYAWASVGPKIVEIYRRCLGRSPS